MAEQPQRSTNAAVVVTSDTCFKDRSKDSSGMYVGRKLKAAGLFRTQTTFYVDDDRQKITDCLVKILQNDNTSLIITVGGTGLCPRDVTPEATSALYEKFCTGIATALHVASLKSSPYAALSRLTAGIHGRCLIVNFPGSLKACEECFACLEVFLGHAIEQVHFDPEAIKETHDHLKLQQSTSCEPSDVDLVSTELSKSQINVSDNLPSASNKSGNNSPTPPLPSSTTNVPTTTPIKLSACKIENRVECSPKDANPVIVAEIAASTKTLAQQSPYPLVSYYDALDIMDSLSYNLLKRKESVTLESIDDAQLILGDVLATDLRPVETLPRYSVSTMDGYVVNVPANLRNMIPRMKTVMANLVDGVDTFEAYQAEESKKFICYQVNTGGRLPNENFVVVPAEKAGPISRNQVPIYEMKLDSYIRSAGSDIDKDDIIETGTVIGPVELSLIIALGHRNITVFKKPRLGLISNGDELVEFYSSKTTDNSVVDTNSILLSSLFKSKGLLVESFGITKDEPEEILLKITESLRKCDILIITGGASMGTRDHVKDVIERIGGTIHFGRVNIKPGKPASFSSLTLGDEQKFIFSLPGNPVSAYITSLVLVIPFIEYGTRNHFSVDTQLTLDCIGDLVRVKIDKLVDGDQSYEFDGRLEFVRAKFSAKPGNNIVDTPYLVTVSIRQQSSRMLNLKDCDCLIMIDPSLKDSKFLVGQTYQALKLKKY